MDSVAVAYSGGRDSTALLHATLAAAVGNDWRVVAVHVHHGLHPAAGDWLAHCAEQCRRWSDDGRPVTFVGHRLAGRPSAGESVEAWARAGRYAALAQLARKHGADLVLLGHHRRDQAETFLLQALRGGGLAGLSAMPRRTDRDGIAWLRPWLDRSGADIAEYVRRHGLTHVEDDSNADPRFARNRLRLAVWPVLDAAFPGAEAALATSARWAQEADAALAELAALDLAAVADGEALDLLAWCGLSPARRSLALRAWLRAATGRAASASLVGRLLDELPGRHGGSWPTGTGTLRAHRGRLRIEPHDDELDAADAVAAPVREIHIAGPGLYRLPGWGGSLDVAPVTAGGVPLAWVSRLELRRREGGERFQAGPGRPPRSLKKQFQAVGVPAWNRAAPLVYRGAQLIFVPGLGLDARVVAPPGQPAVRLRWLAARGGR